MNSVGIDLSASKVAVVVLGQPPRIALRDESKVKRNQAGYVRAQDHAARIRRARRLAEVVAKCREETQGESVIAVESYEALRGKSGYAAAEAFGLVLSECLFWTGGRDSFFLVHPQHVKMFVGLKPHAPKSEVIYQVRQRWGFEHPSDDVIDAYVLAKMAELAADHDAPHTQFQWDILERSFVLSSKRKNLQFHWSPKG